jgi:signal transduction histidine kinase
VDVEATSRSGHDLLIKFSPWVGSAVLHSGWIVSVIDISGVREAERQRDEAMRFITHDIRAPQSSIVATIDLYRREYEHSPSLHVLDRIEKYAMRTLALADEFTRLAQVENRNPASQPFESVDLSAVVVQAADQFWELARARNVRIDTCGAEVSEALVSGNESMLIRAVSNLISNAVKFSPLNAEVVCSLAHSGTDVLISINDQGPGISAEDQQHLFEKFRRFRVHADDQPDGIGLGLAYVKAVAVQHHGRVEVHSFLGQGSTFVMTLPSKTPALAVAARADVLSAV